MVPDNSQFALPERIRAQPKTPGSSGNSPVRCWPLSISIRNRKGPGNVLVRSATAWAVSGLSSIIRSSAPRDWTAAISANLSGVTPTPYRISVKPARAKYSASATVDTVMPPVCPWVARRATSMDFAVFIWGRRLTLSSRARAAMRSRFACRRALSRIRAGVRSSFILATFCFALV